MLLPAATAASHYPRAAPRQRLHRRSLPPPPPVPVLTVPFPFSLSSFQSAMASAASHPRVRRSRPRRRRHRRAPLGRRVALPSAARHLLGGLRRPLVFTPGSANPGPPFVGGRLFVVQYVLLVGAVAIGTLIRRRQRERLRGMSAAADPVGVGLAGRVDKLEESVRGVVAAVRVLSRTVEKLGIRFRVLRRTLRDPISETATLAQKNSEATRILAAQKILLEKEIGAMQKVLYAMQEQQQKQLELILAIGEASNVLDDEQDMLDDTSRLSSKTSIPETRNKKVEINTQSLPLPEGNNKP